MIAANPPAKVSAADVLVPMNSIHSAIMLDKKRAIPEKTKYSINRFNFSNKKKKIFNEKNFLTHYNNILKVRE